MNSIPVKFPSGFSLTSGSSRVGVLLSDDWVVSWKKETLLVVVDVVADDVDVEEETCWAISIDDD